jgi:hypothetical protein
MALMPRDSQQEYSPGRIIWVSEVSVIPEISRLAGRKYSDLADDARVMKGWTKIKVAEEIRNLPGFENTKNEQIYEWFEGKTDPRSSFTKAIESVLGINLPPQCYLNAGKR